MKKTIIALLTLAGVAMAETESIIGSDLTWDISQPYKDCTTVTNGNLTYSHGGWWVNGPTGSLTNTVTLRSDQVLEFSYSFDFDSGNPTEPENSVLTLALVNNGGAVVMGKSYNNEVRLGTTTETGDAVRRGYVFSDSNNNADVANIESDYKTLEKKFVASSENEINTNLVKFSVAYDTAKSKFVGTLAYGGETVGIDLGKTFSVNAITATFDGPNAHVAHVNNIQLKVSTIPEPTTATLSLLALAGLAARRRRQ